MYFALARRRRRKTYAPVVYKGVGVNQRGKNAKIYEWGKPYATRKEAESHPIRTLHRGGGPTTQQTVGELLDEWVDRRSGIAPATKKRYKEMIVRIKAGLGRIRLNQLTAQDIERHLDERLKRQQAGTVLMQFRLIKQAIRQAVRQGRMLTNWSDVNLEQDTLVVRRTISRIGSKLLFKDPKTPKSRRSVELPAQLVAHLRTHKPAQDAHKKRLGDLYYDQGLVFAQAFGKARHLVGAP